MFVDHPEDCVGQPFPIVRPKPQQPIVCVASTNVFKGVVTHYLGRTRYRCLGEGKCHCCHIGAEKRWSGHLTVVCDRHENQSIVCFTGGCADVLRSCYRRQRGLLGVKLCFSRMGMSTTGPQMVRILATDIDVPSISTRDLQRMLERIYAKTWPLTEKESE